MTTTIPTPWRKPSGTKGHGPELRLCGDNHVEIRNSGCIADGDGQEWFAAFSRQEFAALCSAIRAGEYDDLAGITVTLQGRMTTATPVPRQAIEAAARQLLAVFGAIGRTTTGTQTWEAMAAVATESAAPAIREDERQRVYNELGNDHYVIFTEDRWTVEHSAECRLSGHMHECDWHQAIAAIAGEYVPDMAGRWRVTGIDSDGIPDLERADLTGGAS